MKVEDKIALDSIKGSEESHIAVDPDECRRCESKVCLHVCPGQLYTLEEGTDVPRIEHTGCLECGTCLVVCPRNAVKWDYPVAGIHYRFG